MKEVENSTEVTKSNVVIKKLFHKHGDPDMAGYFNSRTWQLMTEQEREMWHPADDSIWVEPGRFDRHASMKHMDQEASKAENLRLQVGSKIDLLGIDAIVLKWGRRQHLVSLNYERKHPDKAQRFGLMERKTADSSYGIRDIVTTFQQYQAFDTIKEAEAAYETANE